MYNEKSPSSFITELAKKQEIMECPWCHNGNLKVVKEGENQFKHWRLYGCTNYTAGCQYTLFLDFNDEKEITSKFESIKRRNVLHIRASQVEQLKKENPAERYVVIP